MTELLTAAGVLGAMGALFGILLNVADKKFHVDIDERVERVRACLSGANCGSCGFAGCDAFAAAVVSGEAKPNGCRPAGANAVKEISRIMALEDVAGERMVARVLCQGADGVAKQRYLYDGYHSCRMAASIAGGPKECVFACIGLGDCADHCAFGAITFENGIAEIDENLCAGCGMCVNDCPRGVLSLMPVSTRVIVRCRNEDVARVARAQCMQACIACGRCVKECQYGAIAIENGCARIDRDKCTRCGKCAEVCPCKCISIEGE